MARGVPGGSATAPLCRDVDQAGLRPPVGRAGLLLVVNLRVYARGGSPSERQPAIMLGKPHVARVDAEPHADAEADRDQHHVAAPHILGVEAADEISMALGLGIAAEQILAVVEVV